MCMSSVYHPQSDGQTERLNRCLEEYLRCMTFQKPSAWYHGLHLAEWWYNTRYHSAIQMTPYQALYGVPPRQINWGEVSDTPVASVANMIHE